MGVTLREIAARVGLSTRTVSRILSGTGERHSAETTERVRAAARRMGYRVNVSARAMRTGRFDCVGLLLSTTPQYSSIPQPLLGGIDHALMRRGLHLVVARASDDELTSDDIVPKLVSHWMADGLLVNYTQAVPDRLREVLGSGALPSVWMNVRMDGDSVYPDDRGGARAATASLIELGHRRVAYCEYPSVPPPALHQSVPDRRAGYRDAMRRESLEPHVVELEPGAEPLSWGDAIRTVLAAPRRPTAVLVNGRQVAHTFLCQALATGIAVPRDLTIVCFAQEWMRREGLPIGTCMIPSWQLGERAVEMLVEKVHAPRRSLPNVVVPFEFDIAEGVAAGPPAGR